MRGRTCPCGRACLNGEKIAQDCLTLNTHVSTRSGKRHALLDIVYDPEQNCLLLQATRDMMTIQVVSAGSVVAVSKTPGLSVQDKYANFWVSPIRGTTEYAWQFERFWIETDMATGEVIVAASNMIVAVFPLHSPVLIDCRAPNTDTQTRRWLRLPWNDKVDRRNDGWIPRRVSRFILSCAERVFNMLFD